MLLTCINNISSFPTPICGRSYFKKKKATNALEQVFIYV